MLAGLAAAQRFPEMARLLAAPALLICAFAGLTLPDIDQSLPLDHRSAVTHSAIPALLALARRWARPVAAGLALGLGLHLSADVFPNAMIGFATVKVPLAGSIGSELSYLWLACNGIAALLLGGWLTHAELRRPVLRVAVLCGVAGIGAVYLFSTDGGWPALALFALAGWFGLHRPVRAIT